MFYSRASRLREGNPTYDLWIETDIPVYMKFHFFNYTNPKEVLEGGKPKVVEMGPYTYLEKRKKVDIQPGSLNDTLQYRQKLWLYFVPELSKGTELDLLTFVNIPFVGTAKMGQHLTDIEFIHEQLDATLAEKGETLFKTASIRDLLFDGISIKTYLDMLQDPMVAMIGDVKIPEAMLNGKFALYENRNGSDDGLYEVKTGITNYKEFGQIQKWNNMTSLPWWKDIKCNGINGTDGTIFSPFLTRETVLMAYTPEVCRSLVITYEKDITYKGLSLFRFSPPLKIFNSPRVTPENECFCTEAESDCDRNGLMRMAGCADGAPITLSVPHFYGGDQDLVNAIDGLKPEMDKHKTFMDIEPMTAGTLRAAKRLQMNIDVVAWEDMPTFAELKANRTFPIMWAEESAEVPDEFIKLFLQLHAIIGYVDTGKYVMTFISAGIIALGLIMNAMHNADTVKQVSVKG